MLILPQKLHQIFLSFSSFLKVDKARVCPVYFNLYILILAINNTGIRKSHKRRIVFKHSFLTVALGTTSPFMGDS